MSLSRVGFIGAGKMASAIASGLVKTGDVLRQGAADIAASCPETDAALMQPLESLGCRDRFNETSFRQKTFWIHFHPQISDKFPPQKHQILHYVTAYYGN
jgi:pyrroline-5-carboxylate reductase